MIIITRVLFPDPGHRGNDEKLSYGILSQRHTSTLETVSVDVPVEVTEMRRFMLLRVAASRWNLFLTKVNVG